MEQPKIYLHFPNGDIMCVKPEEIQIRPEGDNYVMTVRGLPFMSFTSPALDNTATEPTAAKDRS